MKVKPDKLYIQFDNGNKGWYKLEWLIPWAANQTYLGNVGEGRSPNITDSLEKPQTQPSRQTGSLYQYTANKADKLGTIHTYPKVENERKHDEDSHWYWGFSYVEKENGKWKDKSAAIPRKKLSEVRAALRAKKPYTYILQEILGKD
jgi:hypothetical protein